MRTKLHIISIITLMLVGLILPQAVARGATYYVDAINGDDSNPGTSALPWRTLSKAKSELSEGDTLLLRDGNYGDFTEILTADRSDWVTYKADAGAAPIFSGLSVGSGSTLTDYYLWFEGITIQASSPLGAGGRLAQITNANHVKFINCTLIGAGFSFKDNSKGLNFWYASNIEVKGLKIYGTGPENYKAFDNGIESRYTHQVTIDNCEITECRVAIVAWGKNWHIKNSHLHNLGGDGILGVGIADTIIEDNHIHGSIRPPEIPYEQSHNDCIQFYNANWPNLPQNPPPPYVHFENVTIRRNRIYDSSDQIIFLADFFPEVPGGPLAENIVFENNLIYGGDKGGTGAHEIQMHQIDGLTFVNNTVIGRTWFRTGIHISTIANNILDWADIDLTDGVAVDYEDYNIVRTWVPWHMPGYVPGEHTISFNYGGSETPTDGPFADVFVDLANHDYHLASDSLAIDFSPLDKAPATDLEGNIRVDISGVGNDGIDYADAGCYEYISTGPQPPIANAGQDQTVIDEDKDGSEEVTLDGSASFDPDGEIISYVWSEGGSQIATGVNPTVTLSTGTHLITLTVTDDGGLTDTDTVTIIVSPGNQPPVADAGPDQTVIDEDNNGKEQVTLDGSGSMDPDGEIVSYVWSEGGLEIATGIKPTVTLSIGEHLITLTVTDDGGLTDTDTVTIKVLRGGKKFGELPTGCYNNVFNPLKGEKALIVVELSKQARVRLDLYNARGNKIKELADEEKQAGSHKYYWDGRNDSGNVVGSGLYFVHIQAGDYKKTKKIVVVK